MTNAEDKCLACRHFVDDARALELALPGLAALSSAQAAGRADDGVCGLHDRFVVATGRCEMFVGK